ncbi:MAG: TldD/PmbA family protein [Oscillospiraceae bacterium]|nr:TldD/PmbA family protein [Oscillospiraceae bacterium]
MTVYELTSRAIGGMAVSGAQKAQARVRCGETREINIQENKITLMRTLYNTSATLTAIAGGGKGSLTVNSLSSRDIDEAAKDAALSALSSRSDDANDISPVEPGEDSFDHGPAECDNELLYNRLAEFLDEARADYPEILAEGSVSFTTSDIYLENSNGVRLRSREGHYAFSLGFTARSGGRSSSMNGAGGLSLDLGLPLMEQAGLRELVAQSVRELDAAPLPGKFTGDIILSPPCLDDFLSMYASTFLSDSALIAGTSPLKDKLGQKVASEALTVVSEPAAPGVCGYRITADGYRAKDITIFGGGVLNTFLLSLYGSKKTGFPRAGNIGDYARVLPGTLTRGELMESVERGLLVGRFSGGNPAENGDFSGVAKNSFLIERGAVSRPVCETMVSGNLLSLFSSVQGVSSCVISNGMYGQPWLRVSGVTISGA